MDNDEISMQFFGWCTDGDKHDKVWGWFTIGPKIYNFWGKRGANGLRSLKFKQHGEMLNDDKTSQNYWRYRWDYNLNEIKSLQRKKENKGYKPVSCKIENNSLVEIEKIYPGFTEHCFTEMVVAKLSDKIRTAT